MRARLKGAAVLLVVLTSAVTVFLFGYLLAALLRPEWF
jgi:K+-transporting ATPase KdpF subunit